MACAPAERCRPAMPRAPSPLEKCVGDFIASQPLKGTQHGCRTDISSRPRESPVVIFQVQYGRANDCPAGCFYSRAIGIALTCGKLGWIGVGDYEGTNLKRLRRYVVDPGDTALFDEALWARYEAIPKWLMRAPNVPAEVRERARRAMERKYLPHR